MYGGSSKWLAYFLRFFRSPFQGGFLFFLCVRGGLFYLYIFFAVLRFGPRERFPRAGRAALGALGLRGCGARRGSPLARELIPEPPAERITARRCRFAGGRGTGAAE